MTVLNDKHFGIFAGDALARERGATSIPDLTPWKRNTAYCQGCNARKPIAGKSVKGWRCDDCKNGKKGDK